MRCTTQQCILQQVQMYPALQPLDLLKFLHQSTFGCGHLIGAPEAAEAYLVREAATCHPSDSPAVEPLDGNYCRVNLRYLQELCISFKTFSRLFAISAAQPSGTVADLEARLHIAMQMAQEGHLPFSAAALSAEIEQWRAQDYPAIHHSAVFRECYAPAYRVLTKQHTLLLPLLAAIDRLAAEKASVTLAIDGNSAAGKTTLAALLAQIYDCNVFHMDDFFLRPEQRTPERYAQPGGNIDHERFREEVLLPLSRNEPVQYRKFDCSTFTLSDATQMPIQSINIVEGAYSMHPRLEKFYDYSVFLKIDPQTQRQRIEARNGAYAQQFFEKWIPLETSYFSETNVEARCDLVLDINLQLQSCAAKY